MGTHCSSTGNNLVKCNTPVGFPENICIIQTSSTSCGTDHTCKEQYPGTASCQPVSPPGDDMHGDDGGPPEH